MDIFKLLAEGADEEKKNTKRHMPFFLEADNGDEEDELENEPEEENEETDTEGSEEDSSLDGEDADLSLDDDTGSEGDADDENSDEENTDLNSDDELNTDEDGEEDTEADNDIMSEEELAELDSKKLLFDRRKKTLYEAILDTHTKVTEFIKTIRGLRPLEGESQELMIIYKEKYERLYKAYKEYLRDVFPKNDFTLNYVMYNKFKLSFEILNTHIADLFDDND